MEQALQFSASLSAEQKAARSLAKFRWGCWNWIQQHINCSLQIGWLVLLAVDSIFSP